jgi:hypothetical protein
MKQLLLFAALVICGIAKAAPDAIPQHIVGVWVNEKTIMNGQLSKNGEESLYLLKNGSGTWIGGQFPVGVTMTATFDQSANTINFVLSKGTKAIAHGQLIYDPKEKTVHSSSRGEQILKRRFNSVNEETRKTLGL